MKNITLSAEGAIIESARKRAHEENKTLNALFREWLNRYVGQHVSRRDYDQLMKKIGYARGGQKFSRDEMNER